MKKSYIVKWDRVWIYVLLILIIILWNKNYQFETSRTWCDDVNAYATKLEIARK